MLNANAVNINKEWKGNLGFLCHQLSISYKKILTIEASLNKSGTVIVITHE